MVKKYLSLFLTSLLCLSTLAGCGLKEEQTKNTIPETVVEENQKTSVEETISNSSNTVDIWANIQNKYTSAEIEYENEFNDAIYNVANDYIFEFDCNCDALRDISYDVFGVYTTTDFENANKYIRNCATCSIEDGKIIVKPSVVDVFYDIEEDTITADTNVYGAWKTDYTGTWGNLNKLYLVQKYDLTTGQKLDKPIITPFTISHDIESTTLKQKIDENNNYFLEWTAVEGAESYLVYQMDGDSFMLVDKTTNTTVSSDEFKGQLHTNKISEIVNKELEENGYNTTTTQKLTMNADLQHVQNSKFVVVVVKDGKTSGVSNIVDVNELANLLPYQIADTNIEINIEDINDMPAYIDVETVNGNTMQMIINYHGCSLYYENEDSTTYYAYPSVLNTDLSPFKITIHGMPYSEFKQVAQSLGDRQDELVKTLPSNIETNINVTNVPNKEEENKTSKKVEEIIETSSQDKEENTVPDYLEEPTIEELEEIGVIEEPTKEEQPTETIVEEPVVEEVNEENIATTDNEVFNEVLDTVSNNLSLLQSESGVNLDDIIYANSPLEEWMAYCLIARSELIPVPTDKFPETNDLDLAVETLFSAYRQNPTSGIIADVSYSYDYQTFIITYADDSTDRLNKTVEELKKAKEVATSITANLTNDYDKVIALNDYFCKNASYDENSKSTDVDMFNLSQSFIDAHTPYGILCNNYGVCESYSESFILTGRLAGLEVLAETGDLYGAGGHEWNRVKIDGSWCILDITNNDNDVVYNGLCNITDKMATKLLISDNSAYLINASATNDSYEYYHKNNNYADTLEELEEKLAEQLDNNNIATVRCNENITEEDVIKIAQSLYAKGYNLNDAYYLFNVVVLIK